MFPNDFVNLLPTPLIRALDDGVDFWTRLSNPYRMNAYNSIGAVLPRALKKLDKWGPMDDSRGRAMQSYVDPIPDTEDVSIKDYKPGTIPSIQQCVDVLKRWLFYHDLDDEQKHDRVWFILSNMAKSASIQHNQELVHWLGSLPDGVRVDFTSMKFEVYKVLRLGGGLPRTKHTLVCTKGRLGVAIFS